MRYFMKLLREIQKHQSGAVLVDFT